MPHFHLITNVPRSSIPKNFLKELNQIIADSLRKPVEVCATTVVPDQLMQHGTTDGPCGQASLMSIGNLGEEDNIAHSKAISDKVAEIGIPSDRLYIEFNDYLPANIGLRGTTAQKL